MSKFEFSRRTALRGFAAAGAVLAAPAIVRAQGSLDKVIFQTNWRAVSEHGGYYQAVENGIYKAHGIDAEIRMGGPQQNPSQLLLAGRVDMIMSSAGEALNYARDNLPFLCIGSIFQKDPQVLISHKGVGNDTLEGLRGKPIYVSGAARTSYWPFLRAKFGFTDDQIRPYTFNYGPFLADKNSSMQGFITSEPYALRKQGAELALHFLAEQGYDNYQTTINVSRQMTVEKKDVVQRFMNATMLGWAEYLRGGPAIEKANTTIKTLNPDFAQDRIDESIRSMNADGLVKSGDAAKLGIGAMTDERWKSFYETMRDAGAFAPGIDVSKAYSLEFVNKGVGI